MEEMPKTTLTQKRKQISSSAKKLQRDKLDHTETPSGDRGSILRVAIWILVVVFIGVGSALLVTNLLNDSDTTKDNGNETEETPESFPVADGEDEEPVEEEETPEEEPEEEPEETPEEEPEEEPTTDGGQVVNSLAEFSTEARTLNATTTGNTLGLNKFKFFPEGGIFNYHFTNVTSTTSQIDPKIKAYYEGNNLVIEFQNIATDNVTGKNNSTSRTIYGLNGITGTKTENNGNVSKYTFLMTQKFPYRVLIEQETDTIKIQIDN